METSSYLSALRHLSRHVRIVVDKEAAIERIKNRLSLAYDAAETAGYRDLLLNLRVVNEASRAAGVAGHICELQLVLRAFHELRNCDGHVRYVTFRNAMAK